MTSSASFPDVPHIRIDPGPDSESSRKFGGFAWHWCVYRDRTDWCGIGTEWWATAEGAAKQAVALFGRKALILHGRTGQRYEPTQDKFV